MADQVDPALANEVSALSRDVASKASVASDASAKLTALDQLKADAASFRAQIKPTLDANAAKRARIASLTAQIAAARNGRVA